MKTLNRCYLWAFLLWVQLASAAFADTVKQTKMDSQQKILDSFKEGAGYDPVYILFIITAMTGAILCVFSAMSMFENLNKSAKDGQPMIGWTSVVQTVCFAALTVIAFLGVRKIIFGN